MSEHRHTDEDVCAFHDWQKIGMVCTDTATLAIVAPEESAKLARAWQDYVDGLRPGGLLPTFQVMGPAVLVDTGGDGGYDVEARFCDLYGDGHVSVCEIRIRVHFHDEDDDATDA